jgi:hypothetical protein
MDFISLELVAEGTVDRQEVGCASARSCFGLGSRSPLGTDCERALWALEKAGRTCLVSASLATPIRLEPEIAKEP